MNGSKFAQAVLDGKIDFQSLKKENAKAYHDIIERIRSFACIDTIIRNCEYLVFSEGQIEGTTIQVKYLMLKAIGEYNLHLGIDTYKKSYYPKTLLVTKGARRDKFVERASEKYRVSKIEIILKETNVIEEFIDRKKAQTIASKELKEIIEHWLQDDFINQFEMFIFSEENRNIIIQEADQNTSISDLKAIIYSCVKSRKKDEWISLLKEFMRSQKEYLQNVVEKYDPYWSGKIVSETIRSISRSDAKHMIEGAIDYYIENNYEKFTRSES